VYRHPARAAAIRKHCVPLTRPVLPGVDNSLVGPVRRADSSPSAGISGGLNPAGLLPTRIPKTASHGKHAGTGASKTPGPAGPGREQPVTQRRMAFTR
jgi:hypothetical protein